MTQTAAEHRLELMVKQMTWESDGVLSLALVDPDGKQLPEWTPGAHIDLNLRDSLVRQYSLCGDPADPSRYRVAVLREQAALGGSEFVHEGLRPGHRLPVVGPRNNFEFLPARRYVFIAGGIGITPILAMVGAAEAAGADWELYYGGRRRASMAFLDELAALRRPRARRCPRTRPACSTSPPCCPAPADGLLVYCCGPEGLLARGRGAHRRPGRTGTSRSSGSRQRPGRARGRRATPSSVICHRSGTTSPGADRLLPARRARSCGVSVASSCRDGICGTCETRVLEGVPDHRDSLLSAAEQAAGKTMMVCVSRAKSERLVLDL